MTAQQRDMVDQILRDAPFDPSGDVAVERPLLEQMLTSQPLPADVRTTPGDLGGVPVIFIDIADVEPRGTIFHIHGGFFALGSATSSVGLASSLARKTGMRAVSADYRLAPEHPYPAGLQDVTAAYRALAEQADAGQVVVSGESAGGNLAIELLLAGQKEGLAMPAAALLLSPMTDLTASGSSITGKAQVDPAISAQAIRTRAADYLAGIDPADPLVSPIFADLSGLPPLLIQAGSHEVLLDDATRLAVKAAADDVAVILDITPGVPHVFQAFAALLDEGDAALNRAARFVSDNTAQKAAA
jgi:monoterpene epsilon-lactone hydrolase